MKTFLILAGVGLVGLLLIISLFFSEFNIHEKEREWFVRNLRYEFSVTVDSVQQYRTTFADGRVTSGEPHFYREDSLKNSLKKHAKLWLVNSYQKDSVSFELNGFEGDVRKGDSLRFSSNENSVTVFRTGKQVATMKMSNVLGSWGKPPIGN